MLPDDPEAQARLFYLVLLGLAVLVGVFARYRNRMGRAMQHAAIWTLIFVGTVLAIGFVEPLKQQLFSDTPAAVGADTVEFRQARDGHYYATLQINGQPVQFLIDTGASDMVLTRADAEAVGIPVASLNYVIPTMTANGQSRAAKVRLQKVELGPYVDHDVPAMVAGGELNKSLLGMQYLERYSGFRREGDRFYLTR